MTLTSVRPLGLIVTVAMMSAMSFAAASPVSATKSAGPCTTIAETALKACRHDIADDYWIGVGNCVNLKDPDSRKDCLQEAEEARSDGQAECGAQLRARQQVCSDIGEARYQPAIDPAHFVDPRQIGTSVSPNPYLMLVPGRTMIYRNGSERIETTVTPKTVEILGVRCVVIHDISRDGGEVTEDTEDWLAQDLNGNVWYFGEISQAFENGQLASLEGSWQAGVDFAEPGIVMEAAPAVGDAYRQEFSLGTAEDLGKVISITSTAQTPAASCRGTCVLTHDYSPLEPQVVERKFYAPGVGLILTIDPSSDEREQLIEVRR